MTERANVVVRLARPDEYPQLGEITATSYTEGGALPEGSEGYLFELRNAARRAGEAELLAAIDEPTETLVGTVTVCRFGTPWAEVARPGETEIRMLAVAPEAWGRGVADALMTAVADQARSEAQQGLVLVVLEGNDPAFRFYARQGFQRIPDRDWEPLPGLLLRAHRFTL